MTKRIKLNHSRFPLTKLQAHKQKWANGCGALICEDAKHICFDRGKIPCEILMIGEAPGISENCIGRPFVGPAGQKLDKIISAGLEGLGWCPECLSKRQRRELVIFDGDIYKGLCKHISEDFIPFRVGFTNLVGCIPKDGDRKISDPDIHDIKACTPRLVEFVRIAKPLIIVNVGSLAKRYITGQSMFDPVNWLPDNRRFIHFLSIIHPAYILRANIAMQGVMTQKAEVALRSGIIDYNEVR